MTGKSGYVHQSIARAVLDHGADTLFGLMGDANLFMVDHYVRSCGGTFVPVAFEGSAILMAQAYTRVAGRTGVATVTHGPGLTNCITALTEGVRARCPMVLLSGDTPATDPLNLQNTDQRELIKVTGAGFRQMRAPETAAIDIAEAFYRAQVEKRPIVVNMPVEFMWQEVAHETTVYTVPQTPAFVPAGDAVDAAIGMIASSKRPIILGGAGAVGARSKLIRLAERMEAVLATTLKGSALFRGHAGNIGVFGTLSTPAAYEVIAASDCVVSFGASLHFFTTDKGGLLEGKRVVEINNDPREIGIYHRSDAVLVADAGLTADNIVHWLDEAEIPPTGFARELDAATVLDHVPGRAERASPGHIDYAYALDRLNRAIPDDRILVTDGGRFMTEVWCRIDVPDPASQVVSTNFAAIGQGLQQAIGAAHARPDRPVVAFTGDGGFMLGGLTEFNTAVRTRRDLIVVVCNDGAYGAEHIQFRDRQMDPGLSQFDWPSFAQTATALGGQGLRVTNAEDLEAACAAIAGRDRPLLIELMLDPDEVPRMRV